MTEKRKAATTSLADALPKSVRFLHDHMRLKLLRPLCFFDVETTGLNASKDRILTLSVTRIAPGSPIPEQIAGKMQNMKFDPGFPVPPEITKLTGITPLDVFGCPAFQQKAEIVAALFNGCDLCAYNGDFDVDFMEGEFNRLNRSFKACLPDDFALIDPRAAFVLDFNGRHKLEDAVAYYLKRAITDAHTSAGDVRAMIDVFFKQLHKRDLHGTPAEIVAATSGRFEDKRFRFAKNDAGKVAIMFGKHRGALLYDLLRRPSRQQQGYWNWMVEKLDKPTVAYLNQFEQRVIQYENQRR